MKSYLTERILKLQDGTLPHIGVKPGDVAPFVIISGNPKRIDRMKEYLEDSKHFGSERGALVISGKYKNTPITLASTGMGCPSLAITLEELAEGGGKYFIRAGSCASIHEGIDIGDLIIATASVRDEGTSPYYAPEIFPAVADHDIVAALRQATSQNGYDYHLGIIRSTDSFYEGERKTEIIEHWRSCNVIAFEMEASALFVISSILGLKSGTILVPGSNLINLKSTYQGIGVDLYNKGVDMMIHATFESLRILSA